jgi:5-methylcytosine-specific restriction endonuclease McrA
MGACNNKKSCTWWWCNKNKDCWINHIEKKHDGPVVFDIPQSEIKKKKATKNKVGKTKRKRIYDRDGNCCLKCGSGEYITIDHILPLSKGGTNRNSNLQTLCKKCNMEKGDKMISYLKTSDTYPIFET